MSVAAAEASGSAHLTETLLLLLSGPAAVALLFPLLTWLVGKARDRAYAPSPGSGAAGAPASPAGSDQELVKELLKSSQQAAVELQNRVVSRALACGILLTLSFMLFTAKIIFFDEVERVRWFAMAFDLSVLALVLWTFLGSEALRDAWIARRARVEFARQWATVDHILLPAGDDVRQAYRARWTEICREVPDGRGIGERIGAIWDERIEALREKLLAEGDFAPQTLSLYLRRRPRRQERWFSEAKARTSRPRRWREQWLRVAFAICAAVTMLELAAQLHLIGIGHEWEDGASFVWLSSIALATLLVTSLYGQNSRGLLHRYSSQLRLIAAWLREHGSRLEAEIATPNSVPRADLVAAVAAFERIMGDELVDWIEITRRDTSELGPI